MIYNVHTNEINRKSCIDNTQIYRPTFKNDMQMKDQDASEP